MKKLHGLKILCTACALLAAAGAAQATVIGTLWGPDGSYNNVPSSMPSSGSATLTFSAPGINFASGGQYSIAEFLASGGATVLTGTASTTSGSMLQTLIQVTGSINLAPGANNFVIGHDDGVVLYVAGYPGASQGAYGTPLVFSPNLTSFALSPFTINNLSGVAQVETFVLNYNEAANAPADLTWTYANGAPVGVGSGVPDGGSTALLLGAALSAITLLRRKLIA